VLRVAGVLAVLALLAGCGDPAPVPVQNRTIGLKLDEYRILPKVVTAPAGSLTLIARNRGILTHNVAVETIPDNPDDQPQVIARTTTLHPGERSAPIQFTVQPGTYRLVCTISNHDDLGQTGKLIVR
jgi:plastocyanin